MFVASKTTTVFFPLKQFGPTNQNYWFYESFTLIEEGIRKFSTYLVI